MEKLRATNVISESAHEQSSGNKEDLEETTAKRAESIEEGSGSFKFDEPKVKSNRKALILSSQ
jgi:hypothetical protein